jgi:hypothetical protein
MPSISYVRVCLRTIRIRTDIVPFPLTDPTQIGVLFTDATTDYKYRIVLGLPGNIGTNMFLRYVPVTKHAQDYAWVPSFSQFLAIGSDTG